MFTVDWKTCMLYTYLFTLCPCGKNINIHINKDATAGNHRSTEENNVEQVLHVQCLL